MNKLKKISLLDDKDRWNNLDSSLKDQVVERLALFWNEEIRVTYQKAVFNGLDIKIGVGKLLKSFLDYEEIDIHTTRAAILYTLEKIENGQLGDGHENKQEALHNFKNALSFFDRLSAYLGVEVKIGADGATVFKYWQDTLIANDLIQIKDAENELVRAKPSQSIIWMILQAKAECIYGIRIGSSYDDLKPNLDLLKQRLEILNEQETEKLQKNLEDDKVKILDEQETEEIQKIVKAETITRVNDISDDDGDGEIITPYQELIDEINDLEKYWFYRYTFDSGEGIHRKECLDMAIMIQMNAYKARLKAYKDGKKGGKPKKPKVFGRHLINAITRGKTIKSYPDDRKILKVKTVHKWLTLDKRRDKFIYYDSLRDESYSKVQSDNFISLSLRGINDMFIFLKENGRFKETN